MRNRPVAPAAHVLSATPLGVALTAMMTTGSAGHRKLAEFILRHPIRVSALSIDDLAKASGVSAPTISRFARELDLGGFAELRTAVAEAMQTLLDPVAKLRLQLAQSGGQPRGTEMLAAIKNQLQQVDAGLVAWQTAAIDWLRERQMIP